MSEFKSDLKLGAEIASGFFGRVHHAEDPARGPVAVKVLHQYNGESDQAWLTRKETLLREAKLLLQAEHRNVVRFHHIVKHDKDDTLHLVMDLCQGSLLAPYKTGPMTLAAVRRAMTETLLGLNVLHSREMIHRDIKPGNLLVDETGTVRIGDFGLVTDNIILGYASHAGYLDHLAPEVLGGGPTSVKTDIWALGMTMYRMLHGERWYSRLPPPRDEIEKGNFALRLPWLPHIPDAWRRLIRKMMNDDSGQRYQSAMQVSDGLANLSCEPSWTCEVDDDAVRWSRSTESRQIKVEWIQTGRKHSWRADSFPIGKGIKRNLGGASGTQKACARGLTKFFAG